MRGRIARQNSDVHPDAFTSEPKEPFHGRAGKVCAARSGLAARTDPATYYPSGTVHEVAVKTGMMIGVLFHDVEMPVRRFVPLPTRRDWAVGHDLAPDHKVSPLLWDRDHNARILLRRLFQQRLIYLQWFLSPNEIGRFAHWGRSGARLSWLRPQMELTARRRDNRGQQNQ